MSRGFRDVTRNLIDFAHRAEQLTRPPVREPRRDDGECDWEGEPELCKFYPEYRTTRTSADLCGTCGLTRYVDLKDPSSALQSAYRPEAGGEGPGSDSDIPPSPEPGLNLATWLEPAIWTALTDHQPSDSTNGDVWCYHPSDDSFLQCDDWQEWREHVGKPMAAHVAQAMQDYPAGDTAVEQPSLDSLYVLATYYITKHRRAVPRPGSGDDQRETRCQCGAVFHWAGDWSRHVGEVVTDALLERQAEKPQK
jgi:hypothetical protein